MRRGGLGLRAERERYSVEVEVADQSDAPGEVHVVFCESGSREDRIPAAKWREMLIVAGELVSRVEIHLTGARSRNSSRTACLTAPADSTSAEVREPLSSGQSGLGSKNQHNNIATIGASDAPELSRPPVA